MFMHRIKLKNILSFGPDGMDLELKPLNVLIGPERLRQIEPRRSDRAPSGSAEGVDRAHHRWRRR